MARVFDPFLRDQQIDVFPVKRGAKRIGMGRFPPLAMRVFVAFRTVFGGRELIRGDESRGFRSGLAGKEGVVAEGQVIRPGFVFGAGGSQASACQDQCTGWKQQSEKSAKAWRQMTKVVLF